MKLGTRWLYLLVVVLLAAACGEQLIAPRAAPGAFRRDVQPGVLFCPDILASTPVALRNEARNQIFSGIGSFVKVQGSVSTPPRAGIPPTAKYVPLGLAILTSQDGQYEATYTAFSAQCFITFTSNFRLTGYLVPFAFEGYQERYIGPSGGGGPGGYDDGCGYQIIPDPSTCTPNPGGGGPGSGGAPADTVVTGEGPPDGSGPPTEAGSFNACEKYLLAQGCYDIYIDGNYDGTVCCP